MKNIACGRGEPKGFRSSNYINAPLNILWIDGLAGAEKYSDLQCTNHFESAMFVIH